MHVTMTGFREAVRSNVPLAVGQISRVDVLLEVGGVAEVVEVTSELQLLQTDKADTRTELKPTEITSLPLNQYRNYQMLLNLVPGSQPGYNAFSETLLPAGHVEHDHGRSGRHAADDAERRHQPGERVPAGGAGLHPAGRNDRVGEHRDREHGRGIGWSIGRRGLGDHEVGHEPAPRLGVHLLQQRQN